MILRILQGYLTWMIRLQEGTTNHGQTQSKSLQVGLRVDDFDRSCELYLSLVFKRSPTMSARAALLDLQATDG
jgi:hypothetical protein